MSIVKINAIEVPAERADVLAQRFAARAGEVGKADDRTTWLVYTRWRDEEAFEAWRSSQAFGGAHGGAPPQGGPVATGSELWSFSVEQREAAP